MKRQSVLYLQCTNGVTAVQMNEYSYSVYIHQYYSSEYEYTIRPK